MGIERRRERISEYESESESEREESGGGGHRSGVRRGRRQIERAAREWWSKWRKGQAKRKDNGGGSRQRDAREKSGLFLL